MNAPSLAFSRTLFLAATVLAAVLTPGRPVLARESWPAPSEASKAKAAEARRHEEAVWQQIQPELQAWAARGKPYLPQAGMKGITLPQAAFPAFPGAEGAGAHSFGGRGGRVFVVTNLNDSGPGSFREACEAAGPRIVVFNVAGIIRLQSPVHIRAPYITIAGQTAPGDGVCVAGETTAIDTHDVVVRYLRFRRGETDVSSRDDALGGNPIGNVILDHCSASWGFDENLSMYRHMYDPGDGTKELKLPTVNLTIQWCISSEALDTFNHAFGGTWGGRNASFHHNLFACNTGRNPSIGWGDGIDLRNNVLFNWRHRTIDGGDATSLVNVVANYFKPGPVTPNAAIRHRLAKPDAFRNFHESEHDGQWYVAGNVVVGNDAVTRDNWDGGVQFVEGRTEKPEAEVSALVAKGRAAAPAPAPAITQQPAAEAYELVLAGVGASLPRRDPVDERIVREVRTGEVTYQAGKGIITDINQVGGYPEYQGQPAADVGPDGLPLWWKQKHGLDPADASLATKDLMGDGYTVIEKFLNGLDPARKIDWSDPKSNVNTLVADQFRPGTAAPVPSTAPAAAPAPAEDPAYMAKIESRTADILAVLALGDAAKSARVHDIIMAQYRGLNAWHATNDARLEELSKATAANQAEIDPIRASLKAAHDAFLAKLAAELTPPRVEQVKDKMTYGKVQVTFKGYCEIVPDLTEAHQARILELLKEAREEAMDGGSAEEKSAVFKRYKGKINNYLSAQGFDVGKAYKDWGARNKAPRPAAGPL